MLGSTMEQLLLERGMITQAQLDLANIKLDELRQEGKKAKIGDVLIDLEYVDETEYCKLLSEKLRVPYVDLDDYDISLAAANKIPVAVARKYTVLAIAENNNVLTIATNDPIDFYSLEEIKMVTGMEYDPVLASKSQIIENIGKIYSMQSVNSVLEDVNKEYSEEAEELNEQLLEEVASGERVDSAPVVKLANSIVENAYRAGASDIHIEPYSTRMRVRIRIDGDMVELMQLSPQIHASLTTRLKILGGMNIAERRIPQDGRFAYSIDNTSLDVRVSSLPTVHGEKIVIRLLSTGDSKIRGMHELGMTDYNLEMMNSIIKSPHGVMLVTGPTGSGKSTTLYAVLQQLSRPEVNLITVEDPVEKQIDNINQVQVNAKAGMTFAAALRSILRQDPDVIMIGEIRDGETAEIAVRAAITGHLVLSTIHTNDAASTATRLVDMGIPPYMVASSLVGLLAQRLVKILCPHCKKEKITDHADMELLGIKEPAKIYEAVGCEECNNTGYRGRTAIYEIIVTNQEIKQLISDGATADEINVAAQKNGTKLLRDNAAELVLQGRTTINELIRATYKV
ncbi:MAG: GspE/PulE family protein [Oscillospiraceae bacterium]